MRHARLFNDDSENVIDALDVHNGLIDRCNEFVDVEEDFRVRYWDGAKNHGSPHFKIYMSKDDYKRLSPEQKSRYDILSTMRRYNESKWHWDWKDKFKNRAITEKRIKNDITGKYKFADVFYEDKKICIELQHSFIDQDFEERNTFYTSLGIKVIWLYDLTTSNVKKMNDGGYQILENNAK